MFRFFIAALLLISNTYAVGFVVPDGATVITTQTMADVGDVGVVEAGGEIFTNVISVNMQNANQTLINDGSITNASTVTPTINLTSAPGGTINNSNDIIGVMTAMEISSSADTTINNSGLIGAIQNRAIGITSSSDVTINNSGTIASTGSNAISAASSSGLVVNNRGTITTSNANSTSILLSGMTDSGIYNSGSIATSGNNSHGVMFSSVAGGNIFNTGTITTSGSGSHGINLFSAFGINTVENLGTIAASGISSNGVNVAGGNKTLINCGTISSQGGHAISFNGTNNLLVLRDCGSSHSIIDGSVIALGEPLNLNVEMNSNLILTLDDGGLGFGNVSSNNPYVIVGNTLVVVDRAGFAAQADMLADLSDVVLGSIYKGRFGFGSCCQHDRGCSIWVEGVGSDRKRASGSFYSGYSVREKGVLGGVCKRLCEGTLGLFGGAVWGESCETDTTSYIGGLSYERISEENFFGAAIALGHVEFKHKRTTLNNLAENGVEIGHFKEDAFLISPEILWTHNFGCGLLTCLGRYAGLFYDGGQEEGSLYNLTLDSRSLHLFTGSVELGLPLSYELCNGCLALEPYVGGFVRWRLDGRNVDASIADESFSFKDTPYAALAGVLYGARASMERGSWSFYLNVVGSYDNYNSNRVLGQAGISKNF